jgi:hypothetical protein
MSFCCSFCGRPTRVQRVILSHAPDDADLAIAFARP